MYYLNILKEQIKLSFMSVAIYRANFVLMLLQSIINSVLGILCVEFIYIHVDSIAGWSRDEMVILYCSSMIVNQIYRGLINPNHMRFIESISSGSLQEDIPVTVRLSWLRCTIPANTGKSGKGIFRLAKSA